jgi:hypothetical protein
VVSEVFYEGKPRVRFHNADPNYRVSGHSPNGSYWTFATFSDLDGNGWLLQEVTTRPPGRIDPAATSFGSASDLAPPRGGGARRAREADRAGRRELAGPVRRLHGPRAGGRRTPVVTDCPIAEQRQ